MTRGEFNIELGRRIRAAREAAGLKHRDVAEILGISRQAVQQLEVGGSVSTWKIFTLEQLFRQRIWPASGDGPVRSAPKNAYKPLPSL
jgi:predicted transcriptional regulator